MSLFFFSLYTMIEQQGRASGRASSFHRCDHLLLDHVQFEADHAYFTRTPKYPQADLVQTLYEHAHILRDRQCDIHGLVSGPAQIRAMFDRLERVVARRGLLAHTLLVYTPRDYSAVATVEE